MIIKFKDGREIEFKQFGKIWLADSVILEDIDLHGSYEELHELKANVARWFKANAPMEFSDKFKARLPLWKEIESLSFKDKIALREGKTDQVVDYFLGDENDYHPCYCSIFCGWVYCFMDFNWGDSKAVRLCLEAKE